MSVDDFFSRLNPILVGILRSPLHWLVSPFLILVTVTGRRTGVEYTIPVGYQRDGDDLVVMVSEARKKQWWRNFRELRGARLRIRGRQLEARGVLVDPASPEFREIAERTLRRVPGMARVFRVDFDRKAGLGDPALAQMGREIAIVRFRVESSER